LKAQGLLPPSFEIASELSEADKHGDVDFLSNLVRMATAETTDEPDSTTTFDMQFFNSRYRNKLYLMTNAMMKCHPKLKLETFCLTIGSSTPASVLVALGEMLRSSLSTNRYVCINDCIEEWEEEHVEQLLIVYSALIPESKQRSALTRLDCYLPPSAVLATAIAAVIQANPQLDSLVLCLKPWASLRQTFSLNLIKPIIAPVIVSSIRRFKLDMLSSSLFGISQKVQVAAPVFEALAAATANHPTLEVFEAENNSTDCNIFGRLLENKECKLNTIAWHSETISGQLSDKQVAPFISALENGLCNRLRVLTLDRVSSESFISLMKVLKSDRLQIHTLSLQPDVFHYDNHNLAELSTVCARALSEMLLVNTSLINLNMRTAVMSAKGLELISSALTRNNTLRQFMFDDTGLVDESSAPLSTEPEVDPFAELGDKSIPNWFQPEQQIKLSGKKALQLLFVNALKANQGHSLCTLGLSSNTQFTGFLCEHKNVILKLFENQVCVLIVLRALFACCVDSIG